MTCASCGGTLGAADRFCEQCGTPVAEAPISVPVPRPRDVPVAQVRREPAPAPGSPRTPATAPPPPAPPAPSVSGPRRIVGAMIAIAIFGGLAWWLWLMNEAPSRPAESNAARFSGNAVFTQADPGDRLKQLHAALTRYAQEHGGRLPERLGAAEDVRRALQPYIGDTAVFTDPRFDLPFVANAGLAGAAVGTLTTDPVVFCGSQEGTDGWRTAITLAGAIRAVMPADCGVAVAEP